MHGQQRLGTCCLSPSLSKAKQPCTCSVASVDLPSISVLSVRRAANICHPPLWETRSQWPSWRSLQVELSVDCCNTHGHIARRTSSVRTCSAAACRTCLSITPSRFALSRLTDLSMSTSQLPKLRIARLTAHLDRIAAMYCHGLSLDILCRFDDHDGFNGVMVGSAGSPYHFEWTEEPSKAGQAATPRPASDELLLVFYIPEPERWEATVTRMRGAGFTPIRSHNPYWEQHEQTFEDVDGYAVVIAKLDWTL